MPEPIDFIPPGWGMALGGISVPKDAHADELGYNFRSIEAVARAAREACGKAAIMIVPQEVEVVDLQRGETTMPGAYGSRTRITTRVILRVTWRIRWGGTGAEITAQTIGEGVDVGDKAMPKAMTYAWKDLLRTLFLLGEAEQDPDATDMTEAVAQLGADPDPEPEQIEPEPESVELEPEQVEPEQVEPEPESVEPAPVEAKVVKPKPVAEQKANAVRSWASWVRDNLGHLPFAEQRELVHQGLVAVNASGQLPSKLPPEKVAALQDAIITMLRDNNTVEEGENDVEF
jgi:hypothetical protein